MFYILRKLFPLTALLAFTRLSVLLTYFGEAGAENPETNEEGSLDAGEVNGHDFVGRHGRLRRRGPGCPAAVGGPRGPRGTRRRVNGGRAGRGVDEVEAVAPGALEGRRAGGGLGVGAGLRAEGLAEGQARQEQEEEEQELGGGGRRGPHRRRPRRRDTRDHLGALTGSWGAGTWCVLMQCCLRTNPNKSRLHSRPFSVF